MSSTPTSRLPVLDGVRALAVAGVIAFHAFPALAPGGFAGVDVFFVLSGFLITSGLLQQPGTGHLLRFWGRRALRLVPALALLVLVIGTLVCASGGDAGVGFGGQVLSGLFFVTNWHLVATGNSYFTEASPPVLQHLWSLAVEEQFYLLWPLALIVLTRFVRRRRTRVLTLLGGAAASALLMAALAALGHPGRAYYGSDSHAFGLLAGAALAVYAADRDLEKINRVRLAAGAVASLGGLLVTFRILWGTATSTYVIGLPAVALFTVLLIDLTLRDTGLLRRTLGARPLTAIGVRSYGLYLWHWPLLVVLRETRPTLALEHPAVLATCAIVLTVAAAWTSYAVLEEPLLRLGVRGYARAAWRRLHIFGPRRPWVASGAVCLLAVTSVMTLSAATRGPGQTTLESQIEAGQRAIAQAGYESRPTRPTSATSPSHHTPKPTRPTPTPTPTPTPWSHVPAGSEIDAIGDSVMLASAPALLQRFPGISIDAVVSRQATTGPGIVAALRQRHRLRPVILIGLGTNGYLGDGTLAAIRAAAGPDHELVFVNVFEPRTWEHAVNTQLAAYVAQDPHALLVDWHSAITGHVAELDDDGIHPGPTGAARYADTVDAALQQLHRQVVKSRGPSAGPTASHR